MVLRLRHAALIGWATLILASGVGAAAATDVAVLDTGRVSETPEGTGGNASSGNSAISPDGKTVVFYSSSSNLVDNDTNEVLDVFAYDVPTGTITRVSVASDGTEADGASASPSVSGDGTRIVFRSSATNLDPRPVGDSSDLYLHDMTTGETTRISTTYNGAALAGGIKRPRISADGNTVVFSSGADNLVPGDYRGYNDVFAIDITDPHDPITTRISMSPSGDEPDQNSDYPDVSADGSIVVFASFATNLVDDDTNGQTDIFAYDMESGAITRISMANDGSEANSNSNLPTISDDGTRVAFSSYAWNFDPTDIDYDSDVYVYDTATGKVTRVSVGMYEEDWTRFESMYPRISDDGTTIVYQSDQPTLVANDTNDAVDIFAHHIDSGTTTRISVAGDGTQADDSSYYPDVSGDGLLVVYESHATTLINSDLNSVGDVFLTEIVNRPPVVTDGALTVAEDAPIGVAVGTVPAIDPDRDNLAYTVISGDDDVFGVDPDGDVVTLAPLDFETRSSYELTIYVSDGQYSGTSSLTIDVTNVNEPPETSDVAVTLAEDTAPGTVVATVVASDPENDSLSFTIAAGASGLFDIDSVTGGISISSTLDYESAATHTLTVSVGDGNLSATAGVVVTVTDVNEAPVAAGFTANTSEDTPVGTVIGAVTGSDPEGEAVTFTITAGNSAGLFSVSDSGAIRVAGALSHELAPTHQLIVTVSDGVLSTDVGVAINVAGINEPPIANGFDTFVSEGTPIGTAIGAVAATDPNDDPLSFEITAGNAAGLFGVDGTGSILLTGTLDYETQAAHLLTVTVSDGEFSDTAAVTVTVTDVAPFLDDQGSVFENDIEWLAFSGITVGCNPPVNDRFCLGAKVTRGQMAAFLDRALKLAATSTDYFTDDETSIFQDSINRMAAAGITTGCNPPDNDRFCPNDNVTRGQMAAFLVRALGYTDSGGGDLFIDDHGSVFKDAIDKLATAGVTRGCNPPDNDRFCPNDNVTRGQMAAFLHRALG